MYNESCTPYLDLKMRYSAVNFGYRNARLEDTMRRQFDTLPQIASQYLHPTKICCFLEAIIRKLYGIAQPGFSFRRCAPSSLT